MSLNLASAVSPPSFTVISPFSISIKFAKSTKRAKNGVIKILHESTVGNAENMMSNVE